jgi:hypothetical protein
VASGGAAIAGIARFSADTNKSGAHFDDEARTRILSM